MPRTKAEAQPRYPTIYHSRAWCKDRSTGDLIMKVSRELKSAGAPPEDQVAFVMEMGEPADKDHGQVGDATLDVLGKWITLYSV